MEDLITSLSDPDLGLVPSQITSLADKLNNALISIQNGQFKQARNQLNAFIKQVEAAEKVGRISTETADTLIAAANEILASIS